MGKTFRLGLEQPTAGYLPGWRGDVTLCTGFLAPPLLLGFHLRCIAGLRPIPAASDGARGAQRWPHLQIVNIRATARLNGHLPALLPVRVRTASPGLPGVRRG